MYLPGHTNVEFPIIYMCANIEKAVSQEHSFELFTFLDITARITLQIASECSKINLMV